VLELCSNVLKISLGVLVFVKIHSSTISYASKRCIKTKRCFVLASSYRTVFCAPDMLICRGLISTSDTPVTFRNNYRSNQLCYYMKTTWFQKNVSRKHRRDRGICQGYIDK